MSLSNGFPYRNVHFVGIGGTGMNAIAKILLARGCTVTGSDSAPSPIIDQLKVMGAAISPRQRGDLLTKATELVVVSAAIKPDNPEYVKARELKIPVLKYAQALGELMKGYHALSVCGTHGKTTMTAMMSHTLKAAGEDPTFVVGGTSSQLGGSSGVGASKFFVAESCEFDRSFLNFHPQLILLSNVEEDHLDYFKDLSEIKDAFTEFCNRLPAGGVLVHCIDCPGAREVAERFKGRKASYGFHAQANYHADNVKVDKGRYQYDFYRGKDKIGKVRLTVPGMHNVENSVGVLGACLELGLDFHKVLSGVESFRGADRRLQVMAEAGGVTFIDDYAHHPTEIENVLKTVLAVYPGRRVWSVFQPHQYSRTRFLLKDFAEKLRMSDRVVLPEIYFVRDSEREKQLVSARDLAREIRGLGGNAVFIPTLNEIADYLINNIDPGDVVITMGAGDVWKLADELVRRIH